MHLSNVNRMSKMLYAQKMYAIDEKPNEILHGRAIYVLVQPRAYRSQNTTN